MDDKQRNILAIKYYGKKSKKLISRKELNRVVQKFIEQVLIQSNIPDEMNLEQFIKAIAKMKWYISKE
ncbi:uncharacterized protein METZ01_LOCUS503478 [marine metagenome]|uniref:Uncharacterized protein n=1 Tax=marine metagenome TaxID=408172 RepID=A0A383E225_9ZZZZ